MERDSPHVPLEEQPIHVLQENNGTHPRPQFLDVPRLALNHGDG